MALLPQSVGLLILFAYLATGWVAIAEFGALWIGIGGAITFVSIVCGLVFYYWIPRKNFDYTQLKRSTLILSFAFLNILVFFVCVFASTLRPIPSGGS